MPGKTTGWPSKPIPSYWGAYVPLARLSVEVKDWDTAAQVTGELIKRDAEGAYPEARLIQAMARYQLKDLDGSVASAAEALRLDAKHKLPAIEYVMGLSLAAKGDFDSARQHLNRYLELMPRSANTEGLKAYIDDLGKTDAKLLLRRRRKWSSADRNCPPQEFRATLGFRAGAKRWPRSPDSRMHPPTRAFSPNIAALWLAK